MLVFNYLKKNIVIRSFLDFLSILPFRFKRKSFFIITLLIFNSFFDLLGLGAFIPLFSIILDKAAIQNNSLLHTLFYTLGFSSENYFIIFLCSLIISIIIIKNIISLLIARYQANFSYGLASFISENLLKAKYKLGYNYFKKKNSHEIIWEINILPSHFVNFIVLPLLSLLNEFVVLGLIITGITFYNPYVFLLLAGIVFPTFVIFYSITKNNIQKTEEQNSLLGPKLNHSIQETVKGYIDIKMTKSESFFMNRYITFIKISKKLMTKLFVFKLAPTKVIETSIMLGVLILVTYGLYYFDNRKDLFTMLGIYSLAAYRILPSSNRIMLALMNIKSYQYTFDYIKSGQHDITITKEQKESVDLSIDFKKEIIIEGLTFFYEDKVPIVKDINFTISKGETIGIIGKSGSGKTTLMNILLRFLKEKKGSIKIDETILTASHSNSWRKLIGYVQQDTFLIDGTLQENIAFGISPKLINHKVLSEVIEKASLKEFINSSPEGLNTIIGENGSRLSGGQKQRIAIARALYSGAQILFFDEATSALDNETEKEITDAIYNLSTGKDITILIIAHRVTTLKHCDKIMELDKGEMKRLITYQDLLKSVV